MKKKDLIIANAAELLTCTEGRLNVIRNGWLLAREGRIAAVGDKGKIISCFSKEDIDKTQYVDASGKTVLPGFVDCHTHLVFGGDRIEEDAGRIAGRSPREMKESGLCVGMSCSVGRTRSCNSETLYTQSAARLQDMIANGSTTVECKSGYGLEMRTELLQLETIGRLSEKYPIDLLPTFLGAHGWPEDMEKNAYLDILENEILPVVAEKNLASFCDIWVDDGFYTAQDAERVLSAGKKYGLRPKIHAEAYSYIGASDVAAELGAVSSDHLNYTPLAVIQKLRDCGVVGVLLPCTDYVVRHPVPANPRPMIQNGLPVAVGTNCNPGCWCTSMPFALQLACRFSGLSIEEAIIGATVNGAKALALNDRGMLAEGQLADIQIWDVPRHEALVYRLGSNVVESVYKRGEKIYDRKVPQSQ